MHNPRSIVIDPFFDGEGEEIHRPQSGPPVTPESRYGYHDAARVPFANGMPMTGVMRPGPEGLRGTVIPRATLGGVPMGTRPHATQNIEVTIDPHISGQSSRVRLGDITNQAVRSATQLAAEVTPEPYSIETQRLRGAAIMHGLAAQAAVRGQQPAQPTRQPRAAPPPQQEGDDYELPVQDQMQPRVQQPQPHDARRPSQPIAAPNMSRVAGRQPQRTVRPLDAFNQPAPNMHGGRELRAIDLRDEAPMGRQVQPPRIKVNFEIANFGVHEAFYHDVIVESGFIVLVFETGSPYGSRYFPPAARSEDAPPLALNVDGRSEVYLVHTTGIQYAYEGAEFCVLMVERVGQLPGQPQ